MPIPKIRLQVVPLDDRLCPTVTSPDVSTLVALPDAYENHAPVAHDLELNLQTGLSAPLNIDAWASDEDGPSHLKHVGIWMYCFDSSAEPVDGLAIRDWRNFEAWPSVEFSSPMHGTITNNLFFCGMVPDYKYTPDSGFVGTDHFTARVKDIYGAWSNTITITINVGDFTHIDPVGMPKEATYDIVSGTFMETSVSTTWDTNVQFANWISTPEHGVVSFRRGIFSYQPDPNYVGEDHFSYTVQDWTGAISGPISIQVNLLENHAPIAQDRDVTLRSGQSSFHWSGVDIIENDPGDTVSFVIVDGPKHGKWDNTGYSWTYTPDAGYFGEDTITYRAVDRSGAMSEVATIRYTILENHAPRATDLSYQLISGSSQYGWLSSFDDDGDYVYAELVDGPKHGRLDLYSSSFVYVSDNDFVGEDSFTYRLYDSYGGVSGLATVTFHMLENQPPITQDQTIDVVDRTSQINIDWTDETPWSCTMEVISGPSHGTLVEGWWMYSSYQPDAGYTGEDSFTYRVRDQQGLYSEVVTMTLRISHREQVALSTPVDTPIVLPSENFWYMIDSSAGQLTFDWDETFQWIFTPAPGFVGDAVFATYVGTMDVWYSETLVIHVGTPTPALPEEPLAEIDVPEEPLEIPPTETAVPPTSTESLVANPYAKVVEVTVPENQDDSETMPSHEPLQLTDDAMPMTDVQELNSLTIHSVPSENAEIPLPDDLFHGVFVGAA